MDSLAGAIVDLAFAYRYLTGSIWEMGSISVFRVSRKTNFQIIVHLKNTRMLNLLEYGWYENLFNGRGFASNTVVVEVCEIV